MREETALEHAIGLLQLPSRARALRDGPLPRDVEALLNIVAGETQALADAVRVTGFADSAVRDAAGFYVEQILLHPDADCYRALGAGSDATIDQLRRNMALLLRWLHPDHEANSGRTMYVGRVTEAWNNLKTAERRSAYDAARRTNLRKSPAGGVPRPGYNWTVDARKAHASPRPPNAPGTRATGRRYRKSPYRGRIWRILGHLFGQKRP